MATLSDTHPTLLDLATRTDPDGRIAAVVELLNQTNEILPDMVWMEGNLATGHRSTVRTGIPTPTWRKMYGGVQPTKTRTAQITDNTGMLENYGEVDKALADLNGNTAAFRLSESKGIIEGFNQEIADTLFKGDETTEPEAFTGFEARFNDLSAESGDNIINAGGTGSDNASIWLVGWGPDTCHGIVPKGSTAGLQVTDKGQVTVENIDGNNGRMEAYRTHFRWDAGLTVRDWRYVVRIANIDRSELTNVYTNGAFASGANLPELMFQAIELIPGAGAGSRMAFYMDRSMRTRVRQQAAASTQNSTLNIQQVGGVMVMDYEGIPLRRVDALAGNEAQIT